MGIVSYTKKRYKDFQRDVERERQLRKAQKEAEYKARLSNVDRLAAEKAKIKREILVKQYKESFKKKPASQVDVFGVRSSDSKKQKRYNFVTGKYE